MKKLITLPFLLAFPLTSLAIATSAQVRPVRIADQVDAQIRRNNRVGQRGVNRPPIDRPQLGRNRPPLNPIQPKRQLLQQRLMQAIGLTPGQRMRMQEIRRSHEDEVITAGRKLRQARQALDRAIMSEPYSEADVRRATEALAEAHADKIRLDAGVRAQVRGVLTPEQVQRFHQLEREMKRDMKEQQRDQEKEKGPQAPASSEPDEIDILTLLQFVF